MDINRNPQGEVIGHVSFRDGDLHIEPISDKPKLTREYSEPLAVLGNGLLEHIALIKKVNDHLQAGVKNYDSCDPEFLDYQTAGEANEALIRIERILEKQAQQADKILQRLSVIFTEYKNAGFNNSAQVTKNIMNEIEEIVKA